MLYYRIYADPSSKQLIAANMVTRSEEDYVGMTQLGRLYTENGRQYFVLRTDISCKIQDQILQATEKKFGIRMCFPRKDGVWTRYNCLYIS